MREIKFRGLRKNVWIYGYYFYRSDIDVHFICEDSVKRPVDGNSVGQYTEQNDVNGNEIYGGMDVHQVSVLLGSEDIDFTGKVKFYDGTWWIDTGFDAISLFNETCENTIITGEE
ncbi:YopX family protein (plasmid) [Clostridium estertheticum]|uniref:YopX family protein n=1 Tax=Clostridium estertheticum TaxID=238834 RepID=UPI001C7D1921|nr:YopX family protein [Clostridium estertheticum]MBX4259772.1 YopX family protein [Clostridium estertheticum]WLC73265.1 YopX family protein [Clostridium estertheticum]